MPHFASMVKAIKCTWVKRLISDDCKRIEILKSLVLYKNMNIKDIILSKLDVKFIKIPSLFYEQLLSYWYELYSKKTCTQSEVLKSSLWNNKFLLLDNKPTIIQSWHNNGIHFFGDIVANELILAKSQLENKYNFTINHMDYNCIVSAIPADWKASIKEPDTNSVLNDVDEPYIVINDKKKYISSITCKDFYWQFIQKNKMPPKAEEKWKKYLNKDDMNWEYIYELPYKITHETAVQSLQYKILHRFYPCNYTLSIWYDDQTPVCSSCNEVDYLEHFFFQCPEVLGYWQSFEEWFFGSFNARIPLNHIDVLFGLENPNDDHILNILNYCILYNKWFIHMLKTRGVPLEMDDFLNILKKKIDTLKMKYEIEGKQEVFCKKWNMLYDAL